MEFKPGKRLTTTYQQSHECPYCGETDTRVSYCRLIRSPYNEDLIFGSADIRECNSCHREWLIHTLYYSSIAVVYLSEEEVE